MINKTDFQRQLSLEQQGIDEAILKTRQELALKKEKNTFSDTKAGVMLIYQLVTPFAQAVLDFTKKKTSSQNERMTQDFILKAKVDKTAFIVLKVLISSIAKGKEPLIKLTHHIAEALQFEVSLAYYKTIKSDTADGYGLVSSIIRNQEKDAMSKAKIAKKVTSVMTMCGYAFEKLDKAELLYIGQKLLDIFMLSTGLIRLTQVKLGNKKPQYIVIPTNEFMAYINKLEAVSELLTPMLYPMLIPPVPHSPNQNGGFITEMLQRPLVKDKDNKQKDYLKSLDMPLVYRAVNHIQNTAWRINKNILDVLDVIVGYERAIDEIDIPSGYEPNLPPKPFKDDLSPEEFSQWRKQNPEAYQAYKVARRLMHTKSIADKSKRFLVKSLLATATKLKDEPNLYFCYDLDWRGRVYCMQTCGCPNPQGNDLSKSLLEFSTPKPIGKEGGKWLSLAGANSFGDDKQPLDVRFNWAKAHEQDILAVAADPLNNKWWWGADESWLFLAFCFEWASYHKSGYSDGFLTRLPVAIDGACNGLQHFSALLLDKQGAKAVNVAPADIDKPADIYSEVAGVAKGLMEADAKKGFAPAIFLKDKISRITAKRNTMTTPYGVSKRGMADQLLDELDPKEFSSEYVSFFKACSYIASCNKEAISHIVNGASEAMDWLKAVADVMSKADKVFYWTTPSGFVVEQKYLKPTTKRINTFWGGSRLRLNISEPTNKLDFKKIKQGQSPNFIHSLDAAHLILSVNGCIDKGLTSLGLIHDSYATYACDIDTLSLVLKEQFVAMYSTNRLLKFRDEIITQLPSHLQDLVPQPPQQGDLDINEVFKSKYFFS